MNKEFVPYEEALALKELGFEEVCFAYWDDEEIIITKSLMFNHRTTPNDTAAPLYQQAFRWFREKHGLWVEIIWMNVDLEGFKKGANGRVKSKAKTEFSYTFETYEEAELACLRKLIELVNQNKDE